MAELVGEYSEHQREEMWQLQHYFPRLHRYIEVYYTGNDCDFEKARLELAEADVFGYGDWLFKNCPECGGYLLGVKIGTVWCNKCDYKDESENVIIKHNIDFKNG